MATPANCVIDNAMQAIIDAINAMTTDDYFFDYKCAELTGEDSIWDINAISASEKLNTFYCELFPGEEATQLQQGGGLFKDSTPIEIGVYTVSTMFNYKSVLNKVDQDFKKLFGSTHFKLGSCDVDNIERTGFERRFIGSQVRYAFPIIRFNLITTQSTADPENLA